MTNYENLILELLGSELTPKAQYEKLVHLIGVKELYVKTKISLEEDLDYFGEAHDRHRQASKTYTVLIGE